MKRFSFHKGTVFILLGILCLFASGLRHSELIDQRKEYNLQHVPPEKTTPLVTLTTVAFGGFRGLVADALWVRASKMQESGDYFEMVQLANWITQLEPRVPEVWSFQAWNLAYNISVLFPDEEDRWRWVSHGIDLLTKEGLLHNPNSSDLHWDIGWMYQHKIGMEFDLAHLYYKQRLAEGMEKVLPTGTLPLQPLSIEAERILSSQFSLETSVMRQLENSFGPLDWRLPATHSLYWSTKGLSYPTSDFGGKKLTRMKFQSLSVLMQNGNLLHDTETGYMMTLPRKDLIPVINQEYAQHLEGKPENSYLVKSYENFLYQALVLYAESGQLSDALELYTGLAALDETLQPGRVNFQVFVQNLLTQPPETLRRSQAMTRIVTLLQKSKDPEISEVRSRGIAQMARQTHRLYQESRQTEDHLKRTGLPPFEWMMGNL